MGQEAATVSTQRKSDPKRLSQLCRGELDWIVMKALEKDRNRRYETANGLAMDIQRYLADAAVLAWPPSAWYRFRKFARRRKVALARGATVAAALVLAVVVLAVSNALIRAETKAKEDAQGNSLRVEKQRADEATKRADAERKRADALEKWRKTAHYLQINLGFDAYRANLVGRADEMLDSEKCPTDLRHWEWHYLKRLCNSQLRRFQAGRPERLALRLHALS